MPVKIAVPQSMLNFYSADSVKAVVDLADFTKGNPEGVAEFERAATLHANHKSRFGFC